MWSLNIHTGDKSQQMLEGVFVRSERLDPDRKTVAAQIWRPESDRHGAVILNEPVSYNFAIWNELFVLTEQRTLSDIVVPRAH